MESTGRQPSTESLRHFRPFEDLSEAQLGLLARSLVVFEVASGHRVVEAGSRDALSFFLLSGKVMLKAADGRWSVVEHGSESARHPLAQLTPRRYDVIAMTRIEFLRIEAQFLNETTQHLQAIFCDDERNPFLNGGKLAAEKDLRRRLAEDLTKDRLVLPSLPEVAVGICRALENEIFDAEQIAEMIQNDVVITAKLIRAANADMHGDLAPIDSCSAAVARLGPHTTHKLVLSFTLHELFTAHSGFLQQRVQALWHHSTQVGAICFALARFTGSFDHEEAMLAGLLHDIGAVAILSYAEQFPDLAIDPEQLDEVLSDLRGPVGGMILRNWGFVEELAIAAEEAENWQRDATSEPDYADLVIIAQLHSFIGTPASHTLPRFDQVPSFRRLSPDGLTPEASLRILDKAAAHLAHAETLLRS